jgi:hypothetical protein
MTRVGFARAGTIMSDNYLQFSFEAFADLNEQEIEWLHTRLEGEWWEDNHPEEYMGFDAEIRVGDDKKRWLWVYAEESGYVDNVCWLLRQFMLKFRPGDKVIFSWAYSCSKMLVDEFGGGSCLVTAREEVWFLADQMAGEYADKGECEPRVTYYGDAGDALKEVVEDEDAAQSLQR